MGVYSVWVTFISIFFLLFGTHINDQIQRREESGYTYELPLYNYNFPSSLN